MQIGGSIGLSVFTAVYVAAVGGGERSLPALTAGYSAVFVGAAIGMVVAAAVAATRIGSKSRHARSAREATISLH
ncbi:hypothetical protein GCM10027406_24750 [Leifsonia lichenia]